MALVAKFGLSPVLDCFHPCRKGGACAGWLSWPIRFGAECAARCVLRVVGGGALFIPPGADGATSFVDAARAIGCCTMWPKKLTLGQKSITANYFVRSVKADDAPEASTYLSPTLWRGADN